eukprot:Awhi_evm2s1809
MNVVVSLDRGFTKDNGQPRRQMVDVNIGSIDPLNSSTSFIFDKKIRFPKRQETCSLRIDVDET